MDEEDGRERTDTMGDGERVRGGASEGKRANRSCQGLGGGKEKKRDAMEN